MKTKYTYELLSPIIKDSSSIGAVLDKLGLMRTGGNYSNISKKIKNANINTSHFKGQGWSKGLNAQTSKSVQQHTVARSLSNDDVFIKNSTYKTSALYKRLLSLGVECICAKCLISNTWEGNPLRLHVDHIDGNNTNHVISNLRLLCPNCHSQTPTYCGRNKKIKNTVSEAIDLIT